MVNNLRNNVDYNPQSKAYYSKRKSKKYYRNSSSGYISRKEVREFILERDKNKCVKCDNTKELHIDHVIPVLYGFNNNISLYIINNINNLQTLCRKCNCSKSPNKLEKKRT